MTSVLDLIGNTPMVEAQRLDAGKCRLFLKLENQNPGGSIKDRIALSMIEAAEREKKIEPAGSASTISVCGDSLAKKRARPVIVPPVPTPHTTASTWCMGRRPTTWRRPTGTSRPS